MGNSCTREVDVVQSERGVNVAHGHGHERARGRWSVPGHQESVDLDTLLEAPSPSAAAPAPPPRRRRKSRKSGNRQDKARQKSHRSMSTPPPPAPPPPPASTGNMDRRLKKKKSTSSGARRFLGRKQLSTTREEPRGEEEATYHSYEDPGYLGHVELTNFDSDCILQSPPDSPTVIHARWGEPVDDPEESAVCTEFRANPFKLGFCVNCQKQHDVNENGTVVTEKEYKKIARPAVAKTAANALHNPAAIENLTPRSRESDVDLAALLQQRRDILLKLTRLEQGKARIKEAQQATDIKRNAYDNMNRHTMFIADTNSTTLANLRRVGSTGRPTPSAPQSLRVSRTTSVILSPRATSSYRGVSKSISFSSYRKTEEVDEEEPAQNDWL